MLSVPRNWIKWIRAPLLCALFLAPIFAFAADPLVLRDDADTYHLGGSSLDILEDETGKLTIDNVVTPEISRRFKVNRQNTPNFGMTNSAFWFRFTIDDRSKKPVQWLLLLDQPVVYLADLYIPREDGSFDVKQSGFKRSPSGRDVPDRNIILPLPSDVTGTFYLRTWLPGRAQFPLSVLSNVAFHKSSSIQQYLFGVFTGVMVILAVIGFSLFALLRDRNYFYFALYICCMTLILLCFRGFLLAWMSPKYFYLNEYAILLFGNLTMLTMLVFYRSILNAKEHAPRHDRIMKLLIVFNLAMIPLCFITSALVYKQLLFLELLLLSVITVSVTIVCYRKGNTSARYLLYSRLMIFMGMLISVLVAYNLLPSNSLTRNTVPITSLFEVAFVVMALADRFTAMSRHINSLVSSLQQEVDERTLANLALEEEMAERNRLEREIVRVSDNERLRISHALHDGLCQQLIGARLRCVALEAKFAAVGIDSADLQPLKQLLDEAVDHAYDLSKGLWPLDQDSKGLAERVRRLSEQSGIAMEFCQKRGCAECSGKQFIQIHNIAREAITNAAKYSRATLVTVSLECNVTGGIFLEVRDNGVGRNAHNKPKTSGGMGIGIMKHRAMIIDGTLEIRDADGGGTVVVCTAPCPVQQSGEDQHV